MPPAPLAHGLRLLLVASALSGCVVGVQPPPTQAEASEGPPPPRREAPLASAPAEPARVWVDGYWHYDGIRHVWTAGRWQDAAPAYRWSAR